MENLNFRVKYIHHFPACGKAASEPRALRPDNSAGEAGSPLTYAVMRRKLSPALPRSLARAAALAGLAVSAAVGGCRGVAETESRVLVPATKETGGVVYRQFPDGGSIVSLLDVDLRTPGIRVEIAAEPVGKRAGNLIGKARVVAEWLSTRSALAGINGGFFGKEYPDGEKEVVGLLVQGGKVVGPAPPGWSDRTQTHFARSGFGLRDDGAPAIEWATTRRGLSWPRQHDEPRVDVAKSESWPVRAAVGCGPRLIHAGEAVITDRDERLVSSGALRRTFVGYSEENGEPRYLVLATATALTFDGCARVLEEYFERQHHARCREAMALDGGSSTQLAYRADGRIVEPQPGLVTVPSAILIRDTRTAAR